MLVNQQCGFILQDHGVETYSQIFEIRRRVITMQVNLLLPPIDYYEIYNIVQTLHGCLILLSWVEEELSCY